MTISIEWGYLRFDLMQTGSRGAIMATALSVAALFAERDALRHRDKQAEEQLHRQREEELVEFRKRLDNFKLTDEAATVGGSPLDGQCQPRFAASVVSLRRTFAHSNTADIAHEYALITDHNKVSTRWQVASESWLDKYLHT